MKNKTKGQVEAKISEAITKFKIEHIGKGPEEVKSYIIEDMVVIRLKRALTTFEQHLTKNPEGIELVKRSRVCLLEKAQGVLAKLLHSLLNIDIVSFYVDVNPKMGEMFIVLGLSKDVDANFQVDKKST